MTGILLLYFFFLLFFFKKERKKEEEQEEKNANDQIKTGLLTVPSKGFPAVVDLCGCDDDEPIWPPDHAVMRNLARICPCTKYSKPFIHLVDHAAFP